MHIHSYLFGAIGLAGITGEVDDPCKTRKKTPVQRVRCSSALSSGLTPPPPMKNARRAAGHKTTQRRRRRPPVRRRTALLQTRGPHSRSTHPRFFDLATPLTLSYMSTAIKQVTSMCSQSFLNNISWFIMLLCVFKVLPTYIYVSTERNSNQHTWMQRRRKGQRDL